MTTNSDTLPEGWFETSLGKLGRFRTGPFGSMLHKADYLPGGTPIVNPMHIVGGRIVPTSEMAVSSHAAAQLSDFALREGDVVIGRRGEMGRCAVVPSNQDGWLCGTGSMIIRCGRDLVPEFAQLVLSGPTAITAMLDGSVGSTMININQAVLGAIRIRHPAPTEQRAIACVISDLADLADQLDQLIAKKEAVRQGVKQQLMDRAARHGTARRIGDIFRSLRNATNSRADLGETGDAGYLHYGDIHSSTADLLDLSRSELPKVKSDLVRGASLLKDGDLVLADASEDVDGIGKGIEIAGIGEKKVVAGLHTIPLRPTESVALGFSRLILSMPEVRTALLKLAAGVSVFGISKRQVREIELRLPPLEEQRAIAEALTDMDDELEALKTRRDKTQALKQGMMQELLSGRIRLV